MIPPLGRRRLIQIDAPFLSRLSRDTRMDFSAEALAPGRKLQNTEPSCVFFARRGRKQ